MAHSDVAKWGKGERVVTMKKQVYALYGTAPGKGYAN